MMENLIREMLEYKKARCQAIESEMNQERDRLIGSITGKGFTASQTADMLSALSRRYVEKLNQFNDFESVLLDFVTRGKAE